MHTYLPFDVYYKTLKKAMLIAPPTLTKVEFKSLCMSLLWKADSLVRTNTCACAALCASVCVNLVDITLRNSFYWALANTCSTCNAIVADYVSHNVPFF